MSQLVEQLKFDSDGLVCAVIQDHENQDVLMVGYMNKEAFEKTCSEGNVWFYSRSKQRLWKKGESSGHIQVVKDVLLDCDGDALLIRVDQKEAACHVGYRSCFFRKKDGDQWGDQGDKVFDPKKVY